MYPALSVDVLRGRLDVSAAQIPDEQLSEILAVVTAIVDPKCDPTRQPAAAAPYREGCYQLGVKIFQTQNTGVVGMDPLGGFDLSIAATSGLYKSVLGVLAPALRNGGIVVA